VSVRLRRAIARVSIAVSFGCLAAEVLAPGLRHRSLGAGVFPCVTAVTGIVCSLAYLRSTRGRS
jgi:hypothetical protein